MFLRRSGGEGRGVCGGGGGREKGGGEGGGEGRGGGAEDGGGGKREEEVVRGERRDFARPVVSQKKNSVT